MGMLELVGEYWEQLKITVVPVVAAAEDDDNEQHEEKAAEGEEKEEENGDEDEDEDEDEDDDDDDDEDEEEEEEVTDQLEDLREHFKNTEEGKALVHHYEECAERVKIQQQQPGYADLEHKEDCVEEFFHLQHYLDTATAPRLFDKLK
ncbi:AQG_2a_G0017720.mRNA.1.CDS.1 [Saccharomyces cerevisiae]|uniref:Cytochrome b-c1 complex subunit 6, mitochondrial n=9 Tax=Saccharomyces TaxID=4930 RepID=QCR6_YEAST|nr:ubiquinol--cytochrome-c reductase subunit 6 [Saccharomyces cerevisiae S288C]P00127.2 RecName: Full=Cytochrome b-c1 complex subunit 6, mitochondrial; AltName: Full=Complex III subunit 6; AltName: Full=Complex III subunit VI; AltName: Full=Cytochrome c1 non-heme 17 kDa protein; AltName: Full=Mitochondrial hinge protein; AltName: Full=Ubiquinol-cytochrome c oxidoreductase subunit 6; AltName: Full=Ubiquinol-cytochrome c reductase 17 kDa protein [Saccharomyces cerevisiae S288C]6GIQ_F Chain F, Cytoc|eukprot:NP_116691.3 ubiquinol--cytochrome-c reductase subunit 6 [Saccharomyces cerevisiae S288C]